MVNMKGNCYTEIMDWALQIGNFSIGILDMVICVILLSTTIGCTVAGFSRSAAKSIGWVLCFPCALYLTSLVARFLNQNSNIGLFFSTMLAFALSSVVVFAVFNLLGSALGHLLSGVGLGAVDGILGFVWGFVVSAIVSGVIVYFLSQTTFINFQPLLDKSFIYELINPLFPSAKEIVMGALDGIR